MCALLTKSTIPDWFRRKNAVYKNTQTQKYTYTHTHAALCKPWFSFSICSKCKSWQKQTAKWNKFFQKCVILHNRNTTITYRRVVHAMPRSARWLDVAVVVTRVGGAAVVNEHGIQTIWDRHRLSRRHVRPQIKTLSETDVSSHLAATNPIPVVKSTEPHGAAETTRTLPIGNAGHRERPHQRLYRQ